jgi:phosphatidylinositol-3-phosphatase
MKAGWALSFTVFASLYSGPVIAASVTAPFNRVYVIVLENHDYNDIIGNTTDAPYLNSLANTYNLATNYSALVRPSLPNYIAMIGGDTFGISSNASYTLQTPITAPNLVDQLEAKGLTWKTYQESMPYAGYPGEFYPSSTEALYAVKHNPFPYFSSIQNSPARLQNMVPGAQFTSDLQAGTVPNFSFIVPNQCNGMHGLSAYPGIDPRCLGDPGLIQLGDDAVKSWVTSITQSPLWNSGNNAIFITWDETRADPSQRVPMIVINSQGPTGIQDNTAYNHYSLLATVQEGFGLNYLANSATTPSMSRLVAQTSAPAAGVPFVPSPLSALLFGVVLLGLRARYSKK